MLEVLDLLSNYALYLVFFALLVPPFVVSLCFKTYPTERALGLFFLAVFVSSMSFLCGSEYIPSWSVLALDLAFAVLCVVDLSTVALTGKGIAFSRNAEKIASLEQPLDVELLVENRSDRAITLDVLDDAHPNSHTLYPLSGEDLSTAAPESSARAEEVPPSMFKKRTIAANSGEKLFYRLVWTRRGSFALEFVAVRFTSRMRLWRKYVKYPCRSEFDVYPNLCQLTQFSALGRSSRLFLLGVRQVRRVGQDADFERLRDYTQDDQYKFIDWKATARHNKLIVRDFQNTRNQRVIIALDSGRMTMNRINGGITMFDAALNASLALAYIALKQGDEVGLLIFADETRRFIPPRGGIEQMNALIRAVFDVFPVRKDSRYDRAMEYLASKSPKRALLVMATNVLDERNAKLVEEALLKLSGAHLPLGMFMRDRSLFDSIERYEEIASSTSNAPPNEKSAAASQNRLALWMKRFNDNRTPSDEIERLLFRDLAPEKRSRLETFYCAGAAANILNWRKNLLRELECKGALVLDVFPEDSVAPLVNKYLEIKARRLL